MAPVAMDWLCRLAASLALTRLLAAFLVQCYAVRSVDLDWGGGSATGGGHVGVLDPCAAGDAGGSGGGATARLT